MEYRELAPRPALAGDVACLWYDNRVGLPKQPRRQLVLPDGCVDIVWLRGHEPLVAGPATRPVECEVPFGATLLGIRFAPGRAPAFVQQPADELLNLNVPLRELWGGHADRLRERLEHTVSAADALSLLEREVTARERDTQDGLIEAAVGQLRRAPDQKVAPLADALGVSERHLLRRFTAAVGYGPRTFGRVLRFRRFLGLVSDQRRHGWDLARLAAECGFADHAHLARECGDLAGLTPSQLRARWS